MTDNDASFLDDFEKEKVWAPKHGISQRTSERYRKQPDGLPYLEWGGAIYIPKREGAAYIQSRVRYPNRRRSHRAK
jgi:hypothetical protein